jgi:hypothetical protein
MNPESPELDRLFRSLVRARGECPANETILAYANDELTGPDRRQLEEHLGLCGICQEILGRLRSEETLDDLTWKKAEKGLDRRSAPWRARGGNSRARLPVYARLWGAAAAVVVVAIMITVWQNMHDETSTSAPPAPVTRGHAVQPYSPAGPAEAAGDFSWSPLPGASRFHLEVRQGERMLWSAEVQGERYRPPPPLVQLLHPGGRFEWRIQAMDREGRILAESLWQEFYTRSPK